MNKYLEYDSVDFAQEESFLRWVRRSDTQDITFWEEWISKHPEKKDDIDKAIALVNQITFKEANVEQGAKEKVWSHIQDGISKDNQSEKSTVKSIPKKKSNAKVIGLLRLAAVAVMAIAFMMVTMNNKFDTTIQTQYADVQTITLPDGSTVQLNSDSKLSYDTESWATDRTLELDGEAFFEVKKGSSFVVETNNGNVTVLGTSFNVYTRELAFDVYCKTGKVSVNTKDQKTVLTPNQSVTVKDRKHLLQDTVEVNNNRALWKDGIYTYDNVPVAIVVNELERQLDIKIKISKSLINKQYTGSFTTTDKMTALSEVLWPLNLKFTIDGNNVIVTE